MIEKGNIIIYRKMLQSILHLYEIRSSNISIIYIFAPPCPKTRSLLFCFDVTVVCHFFCIFHSWENKSIRILSHLVILGLSETNDNFAHISENVLNNTVKSCIIYHHIFQYSHWYGNLQKLLVVLITAYSGAI